MKISEVITALEAVKETEGDVEVTYVNEQEMGFVPVSKVTVAKVASNDSSFVMLVGSDEILKP